MTEPRTIGHGYKMLEQDLRTGKLYPLFINKYKPTEVGTWIPAENVPTKGYAVRPGWHIGTGAPFAPQLLDANGRYRSRRGKCFRRVWCEVSYPMDVDYQETVARSCKKAMTDRIPENGCYVFNEINGTWIIAGAIRIDRILTDAEIVEILNEKGIQYNRLARLHVIGWFDKLLPADYSLYSEAKA